jgi:SAM-dependent methyltransferase
MLNLNSSTDLNDYRDIFDSRGKLYHDAMRTFPNVRAQEFLRVIEQAKIKPHMRVVDLPSGGAYIASYLEDVQLISLESSTVFAKLAAQQGQDVILHEQNRLPIKDDSVDRVLSIAGLHHVADKVPIFSEMRRIATPSGRLAIADVGDDSFVQRFLDEFVGSYNETGHSGWYFSNSTRMELEESGLDIIEDKQLDYMWCASNLKELSRFCRLLFGMTQASPAMVADGILDRLGVLDTADGVGMKWQLRCFTCQKTPIADG